MKLKFELISTMVVRHRHYQYANEIEVEHSYHIPDYHIYDYHIFDKIFG